MATVVGNEDQVRCGAGEILLAAWGTALPTAIGDSLDPLFVQVGLIDDNGFVHKVDTKSGGVQTANRIKPVKYGKISSEESASFNCIQISPDLIMSSIGGGSVSTSGNTRTYHPPKGDAQVKQSVIWRAEDGLEMLVLVKCSSVGALNIPRKKFPDAATVAFEFMIEDNGASDDWYYLTDTSLDS